jgi:hypothetical protein
MKYLCLCYYDAKKFAALSPAELEALGNVCRPHDEALRNTGRLVAQASLAMPEDARSMRSAGKSHLVAEGAYAPTREPLGAFFIIEAEDMNEAVQIAAKHPGVHVGEHLGGGIEVRACDMYE